jgi:hypothetical protein
MKKSAIDDAISVCDRHLNAPWIVRFWRHPEGPGILIGLVLCSAALLALVLAA